MQILSLSLFSPAKCQRCHVVSSALCTRLDGFHPGHPFALFMHVLWVHEAVKFLRVIHLWYIILLYIPLLPFVYTSVKGMLHLNLEWNCKMRQGEKSKCECICRIRISSQYMKNICMCYLLKGRFFKNPYFNFLQLCFLTSLKFSLYIALVRVEIMKILLTAALLL